MAIKKCGRCGQKVPHHSEYDEICMTCEMIQYYPDDENAENLIGILQTNELALDSLKKAKSMLLKSRNPFKWF